MQQAIASSQRAINPENYESDFQVEIGRKMVAKKGKAKKGKQRWNKSKAYMQAATKKREIERKKAAYTKSQNRKIVNEILRLMKHIKTENVSVKGWQKRYRKAISAKSPGFVQSELKRKAQSAGGSNTCVFYSENRTVANSYDRWTYQEIPFRKEYIMI